MGDMRIKQFPLLVGHVSYAKPVVAAANAGACAYVTDVAISSLTGGALTIAAQPDYPRTIKGYLTDANASITGAVVTITGFDQNGQDITDTITFTAAGAAYSTKAFSKIRSATIATTGTVTDSVDKIALGAGPALGMPCAPDAVYNRGIKITFDGGDDAGTFNVSAGTFTPAGTLDGAKAVEAFWLYWLPLAAY